MEDADKVVGEINPTFVADDESTAGETTVKDGKDVEVKKIKKELTEDEKRERIRILKNVLIVSISFVVLFTSLAAIGSLQSSINKVNGTVSLATIYVALVISCAFLPTIMIKKLKTKWTMCLSMLCYTFYIAAQFYPRIWTLLPAAVMMGLGAAPMWSAKCTYLTQMSNRYAEIVGETAEVIVVRFFGIFFLFFQTAGVWSNLIASTVLSQGVEPDQDIEEAELLSCGLNYCPDTGSSAGGGNSTINPNLARPPMSKIYTLATIFLVTSVFSSIILAIFLDPLASFGKGENDDSSSDKSVCQLLMKSFSQMRHPYQLLIIPLTIWSGIEQASFSADFTAAYVSCGLGVHMLGYIMICEGVVDSICSVAFSPLVKKLGRVSIYTMAALVNLGVVITLRHWMPHPDNLVVFFIVAGLWGATDAVWQTQINALYGVIFPEESEAAFSNYRLWESLGFIFAYVTSSVSCMPGRFNNVIIWLVLGMLGYYVLEVLERCGGLRKDEQGAVVPTDTLLKEKLRRRRD